MPHLHHELRDDANGDGDSTNAEIVRASFDGVEYDMGANGERSYNVTSRNCGGSTPAPDSSVVQAMDYTGDGKSDLGAQYTNGDVRMWASTGDLSADYRLMANPGRLVGAGWQAGSVARIVRGDFTGDGKTDIAAQYTNGDLRAWASTGDLSADNRLFGQTAKAGVGWQTTSVERIT